MQSMSVFIDIAKFPDFQRKNADVSRTPWDVPRDPYNFLIFFR